MRDSTNMVSKNLSNCKSLILPSLLSIFLFLIVLSTNSVSALEVNNASAPYIDINTKDVYYFQHGSYFDVKRECFFNGAPCNVTEFMCYLTIYSSESNSTLILNGSAMSGQTNFYNKTVRYTNLSNGDYRCAMYCTDGTSSGSEIFYIQVNPTGDNRGIALFLVLALASAIVLVFGILFENEYIGFIAGALFIVTGVYVMIFGLSNLANMYTQAIAYVCIGLGFLFGIAAGYKVAENTNLVNGEFAGGLDFRDGFE
jgi:hypothetical protein